MGRDGLTVEPRRKPAQRGLGAVVPGANRNSLLIQEFADLFGFSVGQYEGEDAHFVACVTDQSQFRKFKQSGGTAGEAVSLLNSSCDPALEVQTAVNCARAKSDELAGRAVQVRQSHGASVSQSGAGFYGLEVDGLSLALWLDTVAKHHCLPVAQ